MEVAMNGGKWESDGGWKIFPTQHNNRRDNSSKDDMSHMNN